MITMSNLTNLNLKERFLQKIENKIIMNFRHEFQNVLIFCDKLKNSVFASHTPMSF